MIRPSQRQSISLRVSITQLCQLRCLYCMPPTGVPKRDRGDILSFEQIVRFVRLLKSHFELSKLHITGGEPLVRPHVTNLVGMLASEGIGDLALTTNGHLLPSMAEPLKKAGLGRLNISLESLDPQTYRRLTRGGDLRDTMAGISAAMESGLSPIKLNMIVIKGINSDQIVPIARFGLDRGCEVRFLELMPIGPAAGHFKQWFVSSTEVEARLSEAFDLTAEPVQPGGSTRRFLAKDSQGRAGFVGFISSTSKPFCASCRRLRLTACGELVGCLATGLALNIQPLLHGAQAGVPDRLIEIVQEALRLKRNGQGFVTPNLMAMTGG